MSEALTNLAASVRQRLLNGVRERGDEFQLTLTRYAIERLLYRLSRSPHRDNFILKGARFSPFGHRNKRMWFIAQRATSTF